MELAECASLDATGLRDLVAPRDAAIRAIEAVEPQLDAVLGGLYEDVAAAEGPLGGVPFATKDTQTEAGRPFGFGTALLDGFVAPRDATSAGVMLTARTLRDDLLLALAAQLEEALPWRDRRPRVHV